MSAPTSGVAVAWAGLADLCSPCAQPPSGTLANVDPTTMSRFLLWASNILYRRSGRRWPGTFTNLLLRPAVRSIGDGSPMPRYGSSGVGSLGSFDYRYGGAGGIWGFRSSGSPLTRNGSGMGLSEITLGITPITVIHTVKVDGLILPGSAYRIDDYRWLVRVDGGSWPANQNFALPDTAVGTFSVLCDGGAPPPSDATFAAAALACEFARASVQDPQCRLPSRTQSAVRQGLTTRHNDPLDLLDKGYTGVPEVDLWLSSVNPGKISRGATVASPDMARPVRRTTG